MFRVLRSVYYIMPEGSLKSLLREKFYRFSYLYALDKMVAKAGMLDGGMFVVELADGAVFYGREDNNLLDYSITRKMTKLKKLERCENTLGLICYQYVVGGYEQYYKVKRGDIVVDAGANIGTFTVKAARAVGDKGLVVAIEPERENLEILRMNIEANNLRNVVIVPKGVWSHKGVMELRLADHQAGHSLKGGGGSCTAFTGESQQVQVDTLDNILGDLGVSHVDFLKMDIEGSEAVSMEGMRKALLSNDIYVVIEVLHVFEGRGTAEIVRTFLKGLGFDTKEKGELFYAWRQYEQT